jgi:predicted amidohydrolase YtcJ
MTNINIAKLWLALACIAFLSCQKTTEKQEVDFIWINGHIHTVDSQYTIAEALAIKDGKIEAYGSNTEIQNQFSGKIRDLSGRHVYPGMIDAHSHFHAYGLGLDQLDLTTSYSFDDMIQKVETYARSYPGEWIIGRGWDQNDWEETAFPNKTRLDLLFPDRPVILKRVDGHAALVNSKALQLAGIGPQTNIEGGSIEIKNGQITGILLDNAVDLVSSVIPSAERASMVRGILKAQEKCLAAGLTTVCDAGVNKEVIDIYDSLQKTGDLKLRVYAMLNPNDENMAHFLPKGPLKTNNLVVSSFKLYADGALGSRGALLKSDYCDDPGNKGLQLNRTTWFDSSIQKISSAGFQINTHCIGDSANKLILELYGKYLQESNDLRWRIEHAQIVDPADRYLYGKFNIIPSVQPTHATSDMYWANDRLCEQRMKGAYAFRSLMKENGWIPLGTDFPVEDIHPFKTFYAAVYRKDLKGFPRDGFQKEEALDPQSAIRGMTLWAAKSCFLDEVTGSIEKGKAADLILTKESLEYANQPFEIKVEETWIEGKQLFKLK